jgi:hypothetical protein
MTGPETEQKALQRLADQETRRGYNEVLDILNRTEANAVEWANAVIRMRDSKLYRLDFKSWDAFCQWRWGKDRNVINYRVAKLLPRQEEVVEIFNNQPPAKEEIDGIEKLRGRLAEEIKLLGNSRVTSRKAVEEVQHVVNHALDKLKALRDADIRPPEPAICRNCGAAVQWVTTEKNKRILLDARPGGGVWEIMRNVAVKCEWDKEAAAERYRWHSLSCSKSMNEPLPE